MVIAAPPRRFLATGPVHLALWGALTAVGPLSGTPVVGFSGLLWLLLVGFVGFVILGFAWHLFPSIARRRFRGVPESAAYWAAAELAVVLGLLGRSNVVPREAGGGLDLVGALAWLLVLAVFGGAVVRSARAPPAGGGSPPPSSHRADRVAAGLFVVSWAFGVASAAAWVASTRSPGPGFGYWIAGVHLFLLGQVTLLIFGVSLRLLPRLVSADGPRGLAEALAVFGLAGAIGMPVGFLTTSPASATALVIPGTLEGIAALLFVTQLLWIGAHAGSPRRRLVVFIAGGVALCVGGGVGLGMVTSGDYSSVGLHAVTNLLGFVTLTVGGMWFSMIAPFQFISHRWSLRALVATTLGLLAAVVATGTGAVAGGSWAADSSGITGSLVLAVAVVWVVGSVPVLYARAEPPVAG